MARNKDLNWSVGAVPCSTADATLATLMDIRDELKVLNNVFRCPNALAIPQLLREIKKNTTKKRRKPAKKVK